MNAFNRLAIRTVVFCLFFLTFLFYHGVFSSINIINSNSQPLDTDFDERLFASDDVLKLTIFSDFASIMDDRGEDRSYHKGELYYLNIICDTIRRKVWLKTRGNFRRDPTNCKYPPIMVKFGKLKTADFIFTEQSNLKLVTQCQLENYVLLEYLAYRIYGLFSSHSYRVNLAHITYVDIDTRESYFTRYAFFIEDEAEMAVRIHAKVYKPNVVQHFLARENVITMAMFQYMIGNNDWFVTSKHNTSILKLDKTEDLIAVPYDFDWSMLVDADYTKPDDVPDKLIKDRRVYKGLCLEAEELEQQHQLFNSKKELLIELIVEIKDLTKKEKQESKNYINSFYKTINRPSSLGNIFQKEECVKKSIFLEK